MVRTRTLPFLFTIVTPAYFSLYNHVLYPSNLKLHLKYVPIPHESAIEVKFLAAYNFSLISRNHLPGIPIKSHVNFIFRI